VNVEITERPVFVLGAPRSGTSMMQWALRQHPNLWGGQESDFLVPLVRELRSVWEFGRTRGKLHWISGQEVGWEEFLRHVGYGVNALYTDRSAGLRWVEQTPQYTLHLEEIEMLFPGAQFLVMVRDGRQVVESLRHFVNPVPFDEACHIWVRFNTAARSYADRTEPGRIHFVSYERAVLDTEVELRALFEFIGEPHAGASVDRITERAPMNSSFVGEGKDQKLAPRWTSWTAAERERFVEVAGGLLVALGYEPDHTWTMREPADA
jgi:hypothetical protein